MPDTTRLTHYDPRWRQEFEQTRSSILQSCEGWVSDVQHVGSTAISGIIARPIVDCVAFVSDPAGFEEASICIEGLNFRVLPNPDWLPSGRWLVKPRAGESTHHVYLFLGDDSHAFRMIRLRDTLRNDRELAMKFEETKVHHWKCKEGEPDAYADAKAPLFEAIA
jgi:GrpB-like predicted nucleotidyltransferase (UPF0157 family)